MLRFFNLAETPEHHEAAATLLHLAFRALNKDAWTTMEAARQEVTECADPQFVMLGLLDDGELTGWVGLRPSYDLVWEVHPVVVDPRRQGTGHGRNLMNEVENRARDRGLIGLVLGADDMTESTSLSQVDLDAQNFWQEARSLTNLKHHPFEFYQKCGYIVVGVIPNANGRRQPDILMWKSLE